MIERKEGEEKLVESIAERMFGDVDEYTREIARASVKDVLSAVRDGEVALPDEVVFARTPDKVTEGEIAIFWKDIWRRMKAEGWLDSGLTTLIALSGTGKEEQQPNMPRYCLHCGSKEHYTSEH